VTHHRECRCGVSREWCHSLSLLLLLLHLLLLLVVSWVVLLLLLLVLLLLLGCLTAAAVLLQKVGGNTNDRLVSTHTLTASLLHLPLQQLLAWHCLVVSWAVLVLVLLLFGCCQLLAPAFLLLLGEGSGDTN